MRDGSVPREEQVESIASAITGRRGNTLIFRNGPAVLVRSGPEEAEDEQPFEAQTFVGDLRIDNRVDLARTLDLRATVPDDRLVQQLLLRKGEEGVGDLIGAFAFASWDVDSRRLVCGRDHFGVRPLFYAESPRCFAFGSSLPALFGLIDASALDEVRIAQYLELQPADEDRTFYREIKRLPRGHTLLVSESGCRLRQYWSPDRLATGYEAGEDSGAVERLREVFVEAVRCRVDGRLPVGSFLSGGLDSSSVTCVARSILPQDTPLYTYSAVFPDLPQPHRDRTDESKYIRTISSRPGFESAELRADRLSPMDGLEKLLEIHGQPFDPPNAYLDYAMYDLASRGPALILLDGLEGDVTLSQGIHFLDELAASGEWRRFFKEARGIQSRLSGDPRKIFERYGMPHLRSSSLTDFAVQAPGLMLAGGPGILARAAVNRIRGRNGGRPQAAASIISERLARAVDWKESVQESSIRSEQEAHIGYLEGAYVPSLLEFTHANADYFGLEARHPMFDLRLVREAVRLRPDLKLRDGLNRYAFRLAMQGFVPDEVRLRPQKATLAPNFDLKMANQEKESVDKLLTATPEILGEYVDLRALRAIAARNGYRRIWPAVVLALYLNKC